MISEQQRQQLKEAIFDRLLNDIYRSLSIAEKSARIVEFYERAETVESVFYQYPPHDYQELFDPTRLSDTLNYPSIKTLCTLVYTL